jgi:PAS domain S-box-containing protein
MAKKATSILLIEDNPFDKKIMEDMLHDAMKDRVRLAHADRLESGIARLERGEIDLLLLDLNLPDSQGIETLRRINAKAPKLPIIIYSATTDKSVAAQAVREGAQDYLIKGHFDSNLLTHVIRYALERKRAEEALRESEEKYRLVVENASEGIGIAQDGWPLFFNPKVSEIMGHSREELLSRPFVEFIHPDDREIVLKRHLARLRGKDAPQIYTYRVIDRTGNIRWIETNSVLIPWEGKPTVLNFLNDITDRKEAEDALRHAHDELETRVKERTEELARANEQLRQEIEERKRAEEEITQSERKWRNIFETSRDVIFLSATDGTLIDFNPAGEELFGYRRDEKSKITIDMIYRDPKDRKKFQKVIESRGFIKDFEVTLKRKDGSLIDCLVTATLTRDTDGNITGYQGIIKDITERKRFVDTTLDSITDGVFIMDKNWHITYFNTAAEKITGKKRDEVLTKSCDELFTPSLPTKTRPLAELLETERGIINREIEIIDQRGTKIPISLRTALLKNSQGEVFGGVGTFRDLSTIEELKKEIKERNTFQDIISKNHRMKEIFNILPHIAESGSTILIEGKSGTGKELFAKAIHNLSHRNTGPFVAVNCAALPENLLESELFGYVKGAFTNALKDKPGRFSLAEGGTILLDEIGEIPTSLQVKLLRVLEEKKYEPLGSVTSNEADVRIIASTNRDIAYEVEQKNFREDLFYRLNVVKITLPTLKERREDIPLLIKHFAEKMARRMDTEIPKISDEVMDFLMRYDYPGNVRQLENIIEHAFVLCRGMVITMEYLPKELTESIADIHPPRIHLKNVTMDTEKKLIEETLNRYYGNRNLTAQALNMNRTTLWRKMKKYHLLT